LAALCANVIGQVGRLGLADDLLARIDNHLTRDYEPPQEGTP
jgi:hypothetical protein